MIPLKPMYLYSIERGFVQERQLAPRMLHFGTQQISFECNTGCISESLTRVVKNNRVNWREALISTQDTQPDIVSAVNAWNLIVETYSKCKLTESRDKLVALSGLANRASRTLFKGSGRYYSGS